MGRKKFKANFIDLRGRWIDNDKLVGKIIDYAKHGQDWTSLITPLLCEDSQKVVGQFKQYKNPPDLRMINFNDTELSGINLTNANICKSTLFRSEANNITLRDCYANDTKWSESKILNGTFHNIDFRHCNFSKADLSNSTFIDCKLSYSYFYKAILRNTKFINSDLRNANLNGVDINNAEFIDVKLYGCSLWDIKYDSVKAANIDLSKSGNNSIVTDDIRIAPLIHLLEDDKLVDVINSLKSNTVVILGSDSKPENMERLSRIGEAAKKWGFTPIIIKSLKEIEGESFTKKAIMYSLLAKFVIIENSRPSGHILEFSKVLELGCIVGVLQENNNNSTWLLEEYFLRYPFYLNRFFYDGDFEQKISETYNWCINQYKILANKLSEIYRNSNDNSLTINETKKPSP